MDPAQQRELASRGGKVAQQSSGANRWTKETAAAAGRKGGLAVSADRAHMSEIGRRGGRKGGPVTSKDSRYMAEIDRKGGSTKPTGGATP